MALGFASIILLLGLLVALRPNAARATRPLQRRAAGSVTSAPDVQASSVRQLEQPAVESRKANPAPVESSGSPAARALEDYLDWAKYPPSSRPAREPRDAVRIRKPVSTWRRLDTGHGRVMLRQSQGASYLAPGDTAVVTLSAATGSHRERLRVLHTRVTGVKTDTKSPPANLVNVMFRDDGLQPDRSANDGELTAEVRAPLGSSDAFKGELRVEAQLEAAGEVGSATFSFICTGEPPLRFTGAVRERLESGSLALYLGVQILRSGRYVIEGHLDDAARKPVALLRFNDSLDISTTEVRLLAFGKLLRDSAAVAPFVLQGVQAWRLVEDANPDRELVPDWRVHYTTQAYSLSEMSDREWNSPSKTRHIEGLQRVLSLE